MTIWSLCDLPHSLNSFDVALWIKNHLVEQERAKAASRDGGLKIAGSSGEGRQGDAIGVVLSVDKDEETARLERDREAAAKRQQNALPLWHLQSTISGDLTALGIKESARAEAADANRLPSSNDTILRGLGATKGPPALTNGEDVKPGIIQRVDEADCESTVLDPALYCPDSSSDYDQYYASLAASAAPSGQPTPRMSEFGEEEEDVKPSVEYLDSLNEYRKRSRSQDDVGTGGSTPKIPRVDGHADAIEVESAVYTNGFEAEGPPPTNGAAEDDPVVYGMSDRRILRVLCVLTTVGCIK